MTPTVVIHDAQVCFFDRRVQSSKTKSMFGLLLQRRSQSYRSPRRAAVYYPMSKKSQTASRVIFTPKANHATIDRRYALRPVAEVTGEFIALWCLPHTIVGPPLMFGSVQRCKKAFSTASTPCGFEGSFNLGQRDYPRPSIMW